MLSSRRASGGLPSSARLSRWGRRLLLVRRDDVEHLILIGGPVDVMVEVGIPAEQAPRREVAEDPFSGAVQSYAETVRSWQRNGSGLKDGQG